MARDTMIRVRTESTLKKEVDKILTGLGLSTTEAVNLFYHQILLHQGLPFEVKLPNQETLKTFKDTDEGKNLTPYSSTQEMFDNLDS